MQTQADKLNMVKMRDDRIVELFNGGKTRPEVVDALQSEGFPCNIAVVDNRRAQLRRAGRLPAYEQFVPNYVVGSIPKRGPRRRFLADPALDRLVIGMVALHIPRKGMVELLAQNGYTRTIQSIDTLIWKLRKAGLIPPAKPQPKADYSLDEADEAEPQVSTEAMRRCLGGCGQRFLSDGPANRICGRCSTQTAYICAGVDHRFVGSGL